MSKKHRKTALERELAEARAMLASVSASDFASQLAFNSKIETLEEELESLPAEIDNLGNLELIFGGTPVNGAHSIDANFAADALKGFQEIISKKSASKSGALSSRGPVPSGTYTGLGITGVVHGSFGFTLEELDPAGTPLLPSAMRETLSESLAMLATISSVEDSGFVDLVEELDERLFIAIRRFIGTIHKGGATMKLIDNENSVAFDQAAIARAYSRIENSNVSEEIFMEKGRLLGVIPIARRFEFGLEDNGEVISGKVGPRLSNQFLERIEKDDATLGGRWVATLVRRTATQPSGRTSETFTLEDLIEEES